MTNATHSEPARTIPIVENCDVLVCGAGPAGMAGTRTLLLERQGCLGGVWTAGLLSYVLDTENKTGFLPELVARLQASLPHPLWRNPTLYRRARDCFTYNAEVMKLVLEQMCAEAGGVVRLHTRVVAAPRDEKNRLRVAVTESKGRREAWAALVFIDASGDGDLAAQAGCGFAYGREEDGAAQPMTLMALVGGLKREEVAGFCLEAPDVNKKLYEALEAAGIICSYGSPHLFYIRDGLYALIANHVYGVSGLSAADLTRATLTARAEVFAGVRALRVAGGVWRNLEIIATAPHIGVRDGRRILAHYTVTRDDLIEGRRHEDAVCRVTFPVDVHSPDKAKASGKKLGFSNEGVCSQPYDIPVRALIAKEVDGLLLAGRCISGDFIAHSCYRVSGNAAAMGEAALRSAAHHSLLADGAMTWTHFAACDPQNGRRIVVRR